MLRKFLDWIKPPVYVVTANDDEVVAAQEVYLSERRAWSRFVAWKRQFGGANVCLASRAIL